MSSQDDFKTRFVAVMQDLQQHGSKDARTMYLLGSLASDLSDNLKVGTWSGIKGSMSKTNYDFLIETFRTQGNEHHQQGNDKAAYVIQLLALSLVALTQRADPVIAQGEPLLDEVIDRAVAVYRQNRTTTAN